MSGDNANFPLLFVNGQLKYLHHLLQLEIFIFIFVRALGYTSKISRFAQREQQVIVRFEASRFGLEANDGFLKSAIVSTSSRQRIAFALSSSSSPSPRLSPGDAASKVCAVNTDMQN